MSSQQPYFFEENCQLGFSEHHQHNNQDLYYMNDDL